jgi:hypothetical protein
VVCQLGRLSWGEAVSEHTFNYSLLVKLYRGSASVVERLDPREQEALRVRIPLFDELKRVLSGGYPRHVFLTGNAGDGKTFASRVAFSGDLSGVCVIQDATEVHADAGPPIEALAARLAGALTRGERLLVSINRGQLERLRDHLSRGEGGALQDIIERAYQALRLRGRWPEDEGGPLVVDLGLMDVVQEAILGPTLEKLAEVVPDPGMSAGSLAAFQAAQAAIKHDSARGAIARALRAARASGHHVTMRQLWSLLAYLLTGGRAPDDTRPVGVADTLGARLFGEQADGPLFEMLGAEDPANTPWPALARRLLQDEAGLRGLLAGLPGVGELARAGALNGRVAARIAVVHGLRDPSPPSREQPRYLFDQILERLKEKPEQHLNPQATNILGGIYQALGAWTEGDVFPVWERLCYDLGRFDEAALVANRQMDAAALRFELPRPNPAAAKALGGAWRPPFLWLCYGDHGERLRLPPLLLQRLSELGRVPASRPLVARFHPAELEALWRWLSRVGEAAPHHRKLRVFLPGAAKPVMVELDEFEDRTRLS